MYTLPETELMKIQTLSEDTKTGIYVIEPLFPGYGVTLGNSMRRVLFSSLEGYAVTSVKIEGATHEFTTIPGMMEDIVGLILNLKTLRIKLLGESDVETLHLEAKGATEVRAKNFEKNPNVEIIEGEHYLATLDKKGVLSMDVTVSRGRGYLPTEQRHDEQSPLGTIAVDAIFTPVKKVHYEVENTRVGGMTNFDKLTLDVTTDGSVHPRIALSHAAKILVEQFGIIADIEHGDRSGEPMPEVSVDTEPEMIGEAETPRKRAKKSAVVAEEELIGAPEVVETPAKKKKASK